MSLSYPGCPHDVKFEDKFGILLIAEDVGNCTGFTNSIKTIKKLHSKATTIKARKPLDSLKNMLENHRDAVVNMSAEEREQFAKTKNRSMNVTCQCVNPKSAIPMINANGILRRPAMLVDCNVILGRDLFSYLSVNSGCTLIMPNFPVTVHDLYVDSEEALNAIPRNLIVYDLHLTFKVKNINKLISGMSKKIQRISIQHSIGEIKHTKDGIIWLPNIVKLGRVSLVQRRNKSIETFTGIPGVNIAAAAKARKQDPTIIYSESQDIHITGAFNRESVIVVDSNVEVLTIERCYSPPVIILQKVTRVVLRDAKMPKIYCIRGNGIYEQKRLNPQSLNNVDPCEYGAIVDTVELGGEVTLNGTIQAVERVLLHEHARIMGAECNWGVECNWGAECNWGIIVIPEESRLVRILRSAAIRLYNQLEELIHSREQLSVVHNVVASQIASVKAMLNRLENIETIITNEPLVQDSTACDAEWVLRFNDALIDLNDEITRQSKIAEQVQKSASKPKAVKKLYIDHTNDKLQGGSEDIKISAAQAALDVELVAEIRNSVGRINRYATESKTIKSPKKKIKPSVAEIQPDLPSRMTVSEQLKPVGETSAKPTKSHRRRRL